MVEDALCQDSPIRVNMQTLLLAAVLGVCAAFSLPVFEAVEQSRAGIVNEAVAGVSEQLLHVHTTPEVTALPRAGGPLPSLSSLHAFEASVAGEPLVARAFHLADSHPELAETLARYLTEQQTDWPLPFVRLSVQHTLAAFGVPAPSWSHDLYSRSLYARCCHSLRVMLISFWLVVSPRPCTVVVPDLSMVTPSRSLTHTH